MQTERYRVLRTMGLMTFLLFLMPVVHEPAFACDIAVVSAQVSSTGRPFIWKNFDCSSNWYQQLKYFPAINDGPGGCLVAHRYEDLIEMLTGSPVTPSAGVNEAGFAIASTSVYEEYNPLHTLTDLSSELLLDALQQCVTIADFDTLLSTWPATHHDSAVSANVAVIDAYGGAAMYELFTGYLTSDYMPIQYKKYDANTGSIKEKIVNYDDYSEQYVESTDPAPHGYYVRTNYNDYCPWNVGQDRRARAEELLTAMAGQNRLNYRNVMREVAKDVTGKQLSEDSSETNYSTMYCLSRACTRLGLVIDGVASGDDPRLSVFWCALGEPSIAAFVPYFAAARHVSFLAYADDVDAEGNYVDASAASFFCIAEDKRETYKSLIYSSNRGDTTFGMYDNYINKVELAKVQQWTFAIEDNLLDGSEFFLSILREYPDLIGQEVLRHFADYCAAYSYMNYVGGSSTLLTWNYDPTAEDLEPTIEPENPSGETDTEDVDKDWLTDSSGDGGGNGGGCFISSAAR
ncbi:MAG: hypothetical protein ABFD81_10865 [Syntrophaceae bacterium]